MQSTPSLIVDIANLVIVPPGTSRQYGIDRLTVSQGDVILISTPIAEDGRHLMRVLATLDRLQAGHYRFFGIAIDPNDYRKCLTVKRQIGYVAADAAMISNRTLRENLLLTRFYYENDLTIDLDEQMVSLCREAGLLQKLNQRPSVLNNGELLSAVTIREMGKAPALMLVDRPEDFMELTESDRLFSHLKKILGLGTAVIFVSRDSEITDLANRQLILANGEIRTRSI